MSLLQKNRTYQTNQKIDYIFNILSFDETSNQYESKNK